MTSLLSADDLNDFIRPSVACIKPVEEENAKRKENNHVELEFEVEMDAQGQMIQVSKGADEKVPQRTKLEKAQISLADCLACSGCITSSEEVLVAQHSYTEFLTYRNEHQGENIHYVLNLSQQARASLANAFQVSLERMDIIICRIFREIYGFDFVVSVGVGRKIAYEESYEEITANSARKGKGDEFTGLMGSICPGWVLYVEKTHAELLKHMSAVKSPQYITCKLVKELLRKEYGYPEAQVYNLCLMPCFDKKLEASRDSETVDCVITPKEFVNMLQSENVDIDAFIREEAELDRDYRLYLDTVTPRGWYPHRLHGWEDEPGAAEWSESGGYASRYIEMCQRAAGGEVRVVRGRNEDICELQLVAADGGVLRRAGVINGFKNIQNFVRKVNEGGKAGGGKRVVRRRGAGRGAGPTADGAAAVVGHVDFLKCDYVEVMACPGGCINGGGQISASGENAREWRQSVVHKYHGITASGGPLELRSWAQRLVSPPETQTPAKHQNPWRRTYAESRPGANGENSPTGKTVAEEALNASTNW